MNAQDFIENVREMRRLQKAYFKNRLQSDLIKCKELERKVDKALADGIMTPIEAHLEVMDGEPGEGIQMGFFDKPIRCPGCGELKLEERIYCTNCGTWLPN